MITLAQAAAHFLGAAARCEEELVGVVTTVTEVAAANARGFVGHEQDDWAPLSSATVEGFRHELGFWVMGKRELGYGGYENPLERTGSLRDSIETEVDGLVGIVGSNQKAALYQEMGTAFARYPIPPRPFLAKGMMHAVEMTEELIGEVVLSLLIPVE